MIIVRGDISLNPQTKEATASLFADTRAEVTEDAYIKGWVSGYSIGAGSSIITADGDFAFRKSDGTWNWIG